MPPVILGPRCNRRVTCSPNPSNDRSESALAVNPKNPYNMVGSSKEFTDPETYSFSLAAYFTFDGGQSWGQASLQLLNTGDVDAAGVVWNGEPWLGVSDPTVTFDDQGSAYLFGLMWGGPAPSDTTLGVAVYKSTDGGKTWTLPRIIHSTIGDDKQWCAGDPNNGNVYCVWDSGSGGVGFARTTDHGGSWKGVGNQPTGSIISGVSASGQPEGDMSGIAVAGNGDVYVVWMGVDQNSQQAVMFAKSTTGGDSFSAPAVVASPVTGLPSPLPGGTFRVATIPTVCCGAGKNVVVVWADYREGVSRVYYRYSTSAGASWKGSASGDPLLTGSVVSDANQHDFFPQLASTPAGEIGCTFYEFGPTAGGQNLINVVLTVSTDGSQTFPNRATITDTAWDPTVDAVWAHGVSTDTFIGDYFGFAASQLGFFPFWTDTRTGVQEIFTARVAVNPADVYIRDSSSDTGTVPSPGYHWEAPDLIVRWQQDGNTKFVDQGLKNPPTTDHYVYGRVTNSGPNKARNVMLAVVVGNWPKYAGLPGTEFSYPKDWYQGDWDSAGLQANRLFLGLSAPVDVASGKTAILGPIVWPWAQIPNPTVPNPWHPCLLAEVRTDNDDSAGGTNGCDISSDPDPCVHGSYFWGNNNICQRNLTYTPAPMFDEALIQFPFIIGSPWSHARFVEVIVEKPRALAATPMTLRIEPVTPRASLASGPGELVLVQGGTMIVRAGGQDIGEFVAAPGTVWRSPQSNDKTQAPTSYGAQKVGDAWRLTRPQSSVGFPVSAGEQRKVILSFATPTNLKKGSRHLVRIFQRNDRHVITGSVMLELVVGKHKHAKGDA